MQLHCFLSILSSFIVRASHIIKNVTTLFVPLYYFRYPLSRASTHLLIDYLSLKSPHWAWFLFFVLAT